MSDTDEQQPSKKYRWEEEVEHGGSVPTATRWSSATPRQYSNETPRMGGGESSWRGMATPSATPYGAEATVQTPHFGAGTGGATPMMSAQTPGQGGATPTYRSFGGATPMMGATPAMGATPNYQFEGPTPMQSSFAEGQATTLTAAIETHAKKLEREWRQKNKRLTAEHLDAILPGSEYFEVVPVPAEYNPPAPEEPNFYEIATKSMDTFAMMQSQAERDESGQPVRYDIPESLGHDMPPMKTEDAAVFVELLKFYNVDPVPDEYLPSYLLMRNLFKVKNGDTMQRRSGTRFLLDKVRVFGSGTIVQRIAHIWNGCALSVHEKHYFVDFIKLLIMTMGRESRDCVAELVHMMMGLLRQSNNLAYDDGKQVVTLLARVVGFQPIYDAVKSELTHDESSQRRIGAIVIAVAGHATSTAELIAALEDMSQSRHVYARQSAARAIGELADLMGHAVVGVLVELVPMLERFIQDDRRVRRDVARAVSRIAENATPYGIEELQPLVDPISEECKRGIGSTAAPFLHAFGTLVPLMSPYDAQEHTAAMMPTLVTQFSTPEDEFRRVMLVVVRKCVMAAGVSAAFIRDVMLDPFMRGFWGVRRVAADRRTAAILVTTTTVLAKKLGGVDVLSRIVPDMKDEDEHYQHMVLDAVRRVVIVAGLEAAPDSLVIALLDGGIAAVRQDESGQNRTASDALITICNILGSRLKPYLKQVFDLINRRREHRLPAQRAQAAYIV
ncbi:splicing factor 3B subunit 1 [Strigomonas culicis]|uniref:Splicing factor 3B subunit 1 n=1 Tax=Strigomonas culicis TaxID=28005 RepID=S9UV88_9TRYP|nr:splicing factor 3B subunit 1 [Strigomonas culicis]|eukprot:EPY32674.1 splicing factor 3B subunit 1 [Strigomonas culicis]